MDYRFSKRPVSVKPTKSAMKTSRYIAWGWIFILGLGLLLSMILDLQNGKIPMLEGRLAPGSAAAVLGTDHLGRDLALGLVSGIPALIRLAIPSLVLSLALSLISALILARNIRPKLPVLSFILLLFLLSMLGYALSWIRIFPLPLIALGLGLGLLLLWLPLPGYRLRLPLPNLIQILMLAVLSIPGLLLLFSINPSSYGALIALIGGTSWVATAQFSQRKMENYFNSTEFQNAHILGLPWHRILTVHLLPKLFILLTPQLAWLVSGFIVLEGSLGYLGIGLPAEHWGWGQMLRLGLQHPDLWWTWLFPGLCIAATTSSIFVVLKGKPGS